MGVPRCELVSSISPAANVALTWTLPLPGVLALTPGPVGIDRTHRSQARLHPDCVAPIPISFRRCEMRILLAVDSMNTAETAVRQFRARPWPAGTAVEVLCVVEP